MSIAILGEALIDLIVGADGAYRPHLGGSPYNLAIGLARQGVAVSFLAPFSDDVFGDRLHAALLDEGVAVPFLRRSMLPTSLALVTLDAQGLPAYRLYREGIADTDATVEEIEANLPDDLQVFHTGSLAITPGQLPKICKLIESMHARDIVVSIDVNIRLGASPDDDAYLQGVRSILEFADIVKASDEDLAALQLDRRADKSAAAAFAAMRSGILVVTRGSAGALLISEHGRIETSAYPPAHIADTIGAGDTFHAAFLAELLRSGQFDSTLGRLSLATLGHALDFACAAAAINVSRHGCSPPTKLEVDRFVTSVNR